MQRESYVHRIAAESVAMTNIAQYDSSNFTAASSPAILDVQADLGTNILRLLIICDGPGTINLAVSNDSGVSFSPEFALRAHENTGSLLTGLTQIRLTHTGVDSSYRVLGQAGSAEIKFTRPSSSAIYSPLRKHHEVNAGQVQVASGTGTLIMIYNTEKQPLKVWDFDGVGPANSDLIMDRKDAEEGHIPFGFPFVDGLRIQSDGKGYTVHYE